MQLGILFYVYIKSNINQMTKQRNLQSCKKAEDKKIQICPIHIFAKFICLGLRSDPFYASIEMVFISLEACPV